MNAMAQHVDTLRSNISASRWGATRTTGARLPAPELRLDSELGSDPSSPAAASESPGPSPDSPGTEPQGGAASSQQAADVHWITPKNQGLIHVESLERKGTPLCKGAPLIEGYKTGRGLVDARGTGRRWCSACARKAAVAQA